MVAFYKHDIAGWMDGTEMLADGPYRAYHVVCQLIYFHEGPIEFNEKGLAGRCNQHILAFRKNIGVLLDLGKLSMSDGKISNQRASKELKLIENHRETSAKGGRGSRGVARGYPVGSREVVEGFAVDQPSKLLEINEPPQRVLLEDAKHKTRLEETREEDGAEDAPLLFEEIPKAAEPPDARVYRRGREILGKKAGGVITKLIKAKRGVLGEAMAVLEKAADRGAGAMEFIQGAIRWEEKRSRPTHGGDDVVWRDNLV